MDRCNSYAPRPRVGRFRADIPYMTEELRQIIRDARDVENGPVREGFVLPLETLFFNSFGRQKGDESPNHYTGKTNYRGEPIEVLS